ncbi:sensor histidine kinase [Portibacter marinus]|uniref:sensor histidine kinase n=1 Tax=Portibacter marinus TaxID=2898660 RepID=UPI001F32C217|nr:histidine kinase dimerization/phosphoacceptor domain -containing protein [Portibacter marinus]
MKYFYIYNVILLLFISTELLVAQDYDSLKAVVASSQIELSDKEEAMWQLLKEYSWSDAGYSMTIIDSLLLLPSVNKDSSSYMEVVRYQGKTQRAVGNYVNALDFYQQHFDYHHRNRDTLQMAVSAGQIGIINLFNGNMTLAQDYLLKSHEYYTAKGDLSDIAGANNALASFYSNMDQEEKALERYAMALEAYTEAKDTNGMANVHANTALILIEQKKYEEAERNLKLQGKYDTILGTNWGLGFHHDFMGYLYAEQERYEEALESFKTALKIREGEQSHYNIDESRVSLANTYLKLDRPREAISQAERIFDNKEQQQSLTHQQSAHDILAKAYEKIGDFEKALLHHQEYKSVSDSIYNRDHLEEIALNDAKFNRVEQDNQIALLNAQKEASDRLLSQKNRTIAIGAIGLLLISLLSFLLYRVLKKVNSQKTKLSQALNDKELLIKEIHHRVKNNLQLVSSLLSMQSKNISDPSVAGAIEDGKARVRSMALIHQDLYQKQNLKGVNVSSYLDDLAKELFNTYNINPDRVKLDMDIEDLDLDVDTIIPLGLIINELITNSLKYAFPNGESGTLKIKLHQEPEGLLLEVADDGVGFDADLINGKKSFGTKLIKALSRQLDGDIEMTSENGTNIQIRLRKYEMA